MAIITPLSTLPLPVVDKDGAILETRLKDVSGARSLWQRLRDADLKSNIEMAKIQAMADGKEPFDQAERRRLNQGYLSNFNPNDFKALLDTSLAAYTDLISADETLIDVFTTYGDKEQRDEWSQIMSRNLSRAIRSWPEFLFQYAYISHYFTLFGVGIVYFEDCYNWQWEVANLAMMKIPRDTRACEDKIPYAFVKDQTHPQDLIKYIQNPEFAKEEGWNIPALRKALVQAQPQMPDGFDWTKFEQLWKNNDIVWGENAPTIPIIYGWIKENDGSISIYVFTENALDNPTGGPDADGFLCVKRHAYKSVQEAFCFFTRGIGTNCTYHAIRGLGADIFSAMQQLMRLENRKMDIAFESGPMWQVASEEQIETANMTPWGAGMLVSQGVTPLNITTPLLNNTIEPAVQSLRQTIQQNSGQYTSANALQNEREMTAKETMARLDQAASLSVTSINLYNQSADRHAKEVVRRFTRPGYQRSDPGGHQVHDWIQDCIEDGVPMEAIRAIKHRRTRASRTIGFGSPAARRIALYSLMELANSYDEQGRANLVRDLTASIVGWEKTEAYAPKVPNMRPPIDASIADLQNNELVRGGKCAIMPNENRRVHLQIHLGKIGEIVGQFEEAGQNPEMYGEIVPALSALYEHSAMTLEGYTGDDAPQFRQALQNAEEILVNGTRHLQKAEAEKQAEAQQPGADGQPQQPDPAAMEESRKAEAHYAQMQKNAIELQTRLDLMAQDSRAKIQREDDDAAAKRARDDMDAAAKILRESASNQAKANAQVTA